MVKASKVQKIIIMSAIFIMLFNFIAPNKSWALWDEDAETHAWYENLGDSAMSILIVPTVGLVTGVADGIYKIFQTLIIGDNIGSIVPWAGNHIVVDKDSDEAKALMDEASNASGDYTIHIQFDEIYHIPTMLLTPSAIFEGKVAALNGNFFNTTDASNQLGGEEMSTVSQLKSVVSGWYIALRNIAIVGLLSVLIYIGIRIVIATSNSDKAKYKQFFMDWVIALCLIFFMHYIMSFLMILTESVTNMLGTGGISSSGEYSPKEVLVEFGEDDSSNGKYMYTTFTGVARMKLQYSGNDVKLGYMVMYIAFLGYTVYFSIIYLKRILYLAFFTVIAPLVALTYPIDKMKDGKAQAFNFWLKEYLFYSMLQPLHLLLYTVLVKSAFALATKNMIYTIVAMAFIVPAEKIVKNMFGIRGQTEGSLGGFVGGSVAAHMFGTMKRLQKPPKKPNSGGNGEPGKGGDRKPRLASNPNATKDMEFFDTPGTQGASGAQNFRQQRRNGTTNQNTNNVNYSQRQRQIAENDRQIAQGQRRNANRTNSRNPSSLRKLYNNAKNTTAGRRFVARGGMKGFLDREKKDRRILKGAIKGYATAAGAIGLGAVGLGIGMVGGDLNNTWQGLAAGATIGGYLGKNTGQKAGNALADNINGNSGLGQFVAEMKNGGADENAHIRQEYEYMTDEENIQRILDAHQGEKNESGEEWTYKDAKEYAREEYNMMYNSQVQDVKLAGKAINLKKQYLKGGMNEIDAQRKAASVLAATQYIDKSKFYNRRELKETKEAVMERVQAEKGYSRKDAREQVDNQFSEVAKLYGIKVPTSRNRSRT